MAWSQTGNIRGPSGKEVELRISAGEVQWRLTGDSWTKLIDVADITGPQGVAGEGIEIAGSVATYANLPGGLGAGDAGKGYLVEADGLLYIWSGTAFPASGSGVAFQGPAGVAGTDGKEVEIQKTATHIQWRYVGGSWSNLVALSDLKGDTGATGLKGDAGDEIELQKTASYIQWRYVGGSWTNLVLLSDLKGAKGDTGTAGAKGDPGTPGAKGDKGDTGKGFTSGGYNAGTGVVTFASADGLGFSTGDLRGAAGSTGATGAKGDTGARGSKWFTGSGAPVSVPGSIAGDFYLDTDDGSVYELS